MLFLRDFCETSSVLKAILFVKELLRYVFIFIPIILIIMVSVDFAKNVIAGREDDMKKNLSVAIKRVIMAVVVFFVPTIVNVAISLLEENGIDYSLCFINADYEFIASAVKEESYEKVYQELNRKKSTVTDIETKYTYNVSSSGVKGNGGEELVAVALNEIKNNPKGGKKYLDYFNESSGNAYCSEFVSWCANEVGLIDAGVIPKYDAAGKAVSWFKQNNQWQNRGYCPSVGDIIFFDYDGGGSDHTGIVVSCDGDKVYTVEGNVGGVNKESSYDINDSDILGYGVPNY